jgi:FkbM family methyltransferase
MENLKTIYVPIEVREPVTQPAPRPSITRMFRAFFIEHRLPYRLRKPLEHFLNSMGLRTKVVKKNGLRFQVRRLAWDEGFLNHTIEREDYTKGGFSLKEMDTVIDIGANIGAFSIYAAKKVIHGRVIAFEPEKDNYELLVRNKALNRLRNLIPVRAAVAGSSGVLTLYKGKESGLHSTTKGHLADCVGNEEVDAISLEDVFQRYQIHECRILKLNCEGAEYEILYSAPDYILSKIRRIVMEYHATDNKRQKANQLVEYLCKHNFEVIEYKDYVDHDCGFLCVDRASNINVSSIFQIEEENQ